MGTGYKPPLSFCCLPDGRLKKPRIEGYLTHDVFLVMEQGIAEATYISAFELDIEGVHHELALVLNRPARNTLAYAGFVAAALGVHRSFHHRHLTIGGHGLRTFRRVGSHSDIRIGYGHH